MNRVPFHRRPRSGFTLIELALAMALLALLSSAIVPVAIRRTELDLAHRTGREVTSIQEGARWFYVDQKRWPNSLAELQGSSYLNPAWNGLSPFGEAYTVTQTATFFSVSVRVPAGVEGAIQQLVTTPFTLPEGARVSVTSTIPVPGREASLAMLLPKTGATMTGALRFETTALIWQRDGTPHWAAQLDASNNLRTSDGGGATRVEIRRSDGIATMTSLSVGSGSVSGLVAADAVSAGSGTFSAVNAGSGNLSSLSASQGSFNSVTANAVSVSSLTGTSGDFSGNVSANDYLIQAINHFLSEAQFQ